MATITRFEELEIWQLARDFAKAIFIAYTDSDPFSKDFQLKNQINGSFGSIMDNIAEGFERGSRNEFVRFLSIAEASAGETQSQLYRALDRQYITNETFHSWYQSAQTIAKKIGAVMQYLNHSQVAGSKFKDRTATIQKAKPEATNPQP